MFYHCYHVARSRTREDSVNKTDVVEKPRMRSDIPPFRAGDVIKVHVRVTEAGRARIQVFEGVVIRRRGGGLRETITVRKVSFGVGVERTFPLHSPVIAKIQVGRRGDVRRAKLYYLRERRGKRARIRELRDTGLPTEVEAPETEVPETEAPAADQTTEPDDATEPAPAAEAPGGEA